MKAETEAALLSQIAAAKVAGGQVHEPTEFGDDSVSSGVYFGQERFRQETERIFWRSWIPVARQAELIAESSAARAIAGAEIVLTRDASGVIRGFYNTCRHRGSTVAKGTQCGRRLVCPYHAWSYDLNGCLTAVPDATAFAPTFDRSQFGLQPVAVDTALGWIWANLADNPPPLREFLGEPLLDELSNWPFDAVEWKGSREVEGDFNWKIGIEGFLEPNHSPTVHRRSVSPIVNYKHGAMAWWGDHSRMVLMLRDPEIYERDGLLGRVAYASGIEVFPSLNTVQRTTNFVYFLWPGTVLNLLPNHLSVFTVEPLNSGRTRLKVEILGQPTTNEAQREFWESVLNTYVTLLHEDANAFVDVQRGLSGPRRPTLALSHYDRRIRHFRNLLHARMA